jgi:hypothetical protein
MKEERLWPPGCSFRFFFRTCFHHARRYYPNTQVTRVQRFFWSLFGRVLTNFSNRSALRFGVRPLFGCEPKCTSVQLMVYFVGILIVFRIPIEGILRPGLG